MVCTSGHIFMPAAVVTGHTTAEQAGSKLQHFTFTYACAHLLADYSTARAQGSSRAAASPPLCAVSLIAAAWHSIAQQYRTAA